MSRVWFTPNNDAYISQYYLSTNFGTTYYLFTNRYHGLDDEYRALIEFPYEIAPHHSIKKAYLRLWIYRNEIPATATTNLCIHPVVQDWDELDVTWNNRPNYDLDFYICKAINPGFVNQWLEIDVTSLVKAWHSRHIVNDGIVVKCDEVFDSLIGFYSSKYEDSTYWPRLGVDYTVD